MELKPSLKSLLIISTLPVGAILYVPIKKFFEGLEAPYAFAIISIIFSIGTIYNSNNKKHLIIYALICSISSFLFYQNNTSENIFLGNLVAQDIATEAPGYTELKLYESGIATIGYGGVFGINKEFYATYGIKKDTVEIFKNGEDFDLLNHSIFFNQKEHHINFLTHSKILKSITTKSDSNYTPIEIIP